MKRLFAIIVLLVCTVSLCAQTGAAISGQVVAPQGGVAAFTQITVCPYTASGTPCFPQATIYADPGLVTSLTQPFTTDQNGNFNFWIASGTYIVQAKVSALVTYTFTYSVASTSQGTTSGVGPPSSPCSSVNSGQIYTNTLNNNIYSCNGATSTWALIGGTLAASPQFSLFYQPNSGSSSAAQGDANITTDGSGHLSALSIASPNLPVPAIGTGIDPTGMADSSTGLQNKINAAYATGNGGALVLPCGTYKLTASGLTLPAAISPTAKAVTLKGIQPNCATLELGANNVTLLTAGTGSQIGDLTLDANGFTTGTVGLNASSQVVGTGMVYIKGGFATPMELLGNANTSSGTFYTNWAFVSIDGANSSGTPTSPYGVYAFTTGTKPFASWVAQNRFWFLKVRNTTTACLYNSSGGSIQMFGIDCESTPGVGIWNDYGVIQAVTGDLEQNVQGAFYNNPAWFVDGNSSVWSNATLAGMLPVNTTGSMSSSSAILTVASSSNIAPAQVLRVAGSNFGSGRAYSRVVTVAVTATGTAVLTTQTVTSITLGTGGGSYAATPTVTITGGGGTGATAHAVLSGGAVSNFVVDTPGSGYTSVPTVVVTGQVTLADNTSASVSGGAVYGPITPQFAASGSDSPSNYTSDVYSESLHFHNSEYLQDSYLAGTEYLYPELGTTTHQMYANGGTTDWFIGDSSFTQKFHFNIATGNFDALSYTQNGSALPFCQIAGGTGCVLTGSITTPTVIASDGVHTLQVQQSGGTESQLVSSYITGGVAYPLRLATIGNTGILLGTDNSVTIHSLASLACIGTDSNGKLISCTAAIPWSLTTTSGTSDNVTVTGMTASGHCSMAPVNASAATNIATTYISNVTTNQITVTHTATASMAYTGVCTSN